MDENALIPTRELFTKHSLRCTKQRMALYDALRQCTSHPTAEELYRLVKPHTNGLSRATVYNTLETLCRAGLARQLPSAGCCRYDSDTNEHLHFRCRETAQLQDGPFELGRELIDNLPSSVLGEIERRMGRRGNGSIKSSTQSSRTRKRLQNSAPKS